MRTLRELAERVGGEVVGDGSIVIRGVQPIERAQAGDMTLAAQPRYRDRLGDSAASAAIVASPIDPAPMPLLVATNPKLAFAQALELFHRRPFAAQGVSPMAFVDQDCSLPAEVTIEPFARIGPGVEIGPRTRIGSGVAVGEGCRVGSDCELHSNATLYPGVVLGDRVILHSGSVIGADGFGYVFDGHKQVKIQQTGRVRIGDDVEIGANSCVDRATFGETVLEAWVKLDNLVHVAHNCRIGENTVIVGCVGIAGSVTIGKNCVLAGQSGVIDHVTIGDGVVVMVRGHVTKDVPDGAVVSGWGRDHREELKIQGIRRRLPEMYRDWLKGRKRQDRTAPESPSGKKKRRP